MRIGVDVGGTNTDAVLMDGRRVLGAVKSTTTLDIGTGIVSSISTLLKQAGAEPHRIRAVMIGTTQFTNAFVERKRLEKVGVLRLSLPAASSLRPLVDWPKDLIAGIGEHTILAHGGYQYDGRCIHPLDDDEILEAARSFTAKGIRSVAVSCVFAPINEQMEQHAAKLLVSSMPDVKVSVSNELGRVSLIERENATIMNASLTTLAQQVVDAFEYALDELSIDAPFFISQNDGTLMQPAYVRKYPVLTFASGPTNSMRGAAFLSGLQDAIVVDIGGTTTDVGVIVSGFPRESAIAVDIGGVRTNFRMPDILSIGLGGGSLVRSDSDTVIIGPESVGYRLEQDALVFGGSVMTATDLAVAAGTAKIGDAERVSDIDHKFVDSGLDKIHAMVGEAIDRVKTSAQPVPVVLVGGGAVLISRDLEGVSTLQIPENAGVANAIGASLAQVGGEVDRVFCYEQTGRDEALELAQREARENAVAAGAHSEKVEILDIEEVPLAYLPGGAVRVRVKAVGDLAIP